MNGRLLIGALALSLASSLSTNIATAQVVVIENDAATNDVSDLSTREQRLAIPPVDWDEARGAGLRPTTDDDPPEVEDFQAEASDVGASSGGEAASGADAEALSLYPLEWQGLQSNTQFEDLSDDPDGPGALGTKDVFTQYCENCSGVNLKSPQKRIGKLFSSGGSCTASVVSGKDVIVTAAHCCYNRGAGSWNSNFRYAPAYRDGFSPYGLFNWQSAAILPRWISHGDRKSDVCVIKLRKNASNRGVTHYTGWLGRSWNFGTKQSLHALGYPGNIGSGNKLQLCAAESFNPSGSCGGSSVLNMGCSMTYGASGGPWIRGYRGSNRVNAVVSGYDSTSCTGTFGKTFNGPRFTSSNIVELCNRIGC